VGAAIFLRVCLRNLLPHVFLGGIMKKWCVVCGVIGIVVLTC
jgi:hypothetical protein